MMRADRTVPSLSLGLLVDPGARYDPTHHWVSAAGIRCCSVGFDCGGYSRASIQGPPAALRELAAALIQAADLADHDATPRVAERVAG